MDALIVMTKAADTLLVHPTCVADHQRAGWVIDTTPKPVEVLPAVTADIKPIKPRVRKAQP